MLLTQWFRWITIKVYQVGLTSLPPTSALAVRSEYCGTFIIAAEDERID
jgi:hypothetical protein